jgi:ABC-type transport system involved in multi-copper enzyme maturation permease subunit
VKALTIARRELGAYLFQPLSYLVIGFFLAVEGYSFWLLLSLLSGRSTPHGAILQYFFGGTFLYWLFVIFLVSVLTMRLVAEERQCGTLEPLLTAPVRERDIIFGKYLGALGFWVALWAPTLLYVALLAAYAPGSARLDPGPIASGYFGTIVVGASAIAVGLWSSTLTRSQIVAAVLCFSILTIVLLLGALGDATIQTGPLGAVLRYIDLFRQMEDFGRGIVDTRHLVHHGCVIVLSLFLAVRRLESARI